ncbi:MAG: PEP-utilizing enzyme [Nostoc sp.]|uniref:PEP-utilizing enzyme n=1 Tax=Nostoc sp. TaxID=1180 RepID=UPI002FFA99D5
MNQQITVELEKFVPPSPGAWELESTHVPRPLSRWLAPIFVPAYMRGFKATGAQYGSLLDYIEVVTINGFMYICPRIVGVPKKAKETPPYLIYKLSNWLNPEVRKRIKRAGEVFEKKLWREDVKLWDKECKPALVKKNLALQAVDPEKLSTEDLISHLNACKEAMSEAIYYHHRFNNCAMTPLGDFLVYAQKWTGLPTHKLLELMQGYSPVSAGAMAELERLAQVVRQHPETLDQLKSNLQPEEILRSLQQSSPEIASATNDYLNLAGMRVITGYDVADLRAIEVPEVLVRAIQEAVASVDRHQVAQMIAEKTNQVRTAVPEQHRQAFDDLLAEARYTYRIRDERVYFNDAWTTGIARQAILATGKRLAEAGKIFALDHAVDFTNEELTAALLGKDAPSAEQIAQYVKYRTTKTAADVPTHLGHPASLPPPPEWLPPDGARMTRAGNAVLSNIFAPPAQQTQVRTLKGLPASPGQYEGIARLVLNPDDMAKVQPGEVVVARMTAPAYNVLLPIIKGIITDRGGLLSHAAIVAREYGLPAVVGCMDATKMIPNGARIQVDGTKGEVKIL